MNPLLVSMQGNNDDTAESDTPLVKPPKLGRPAKPMAARNTENLPKPDKPLKPVKRKLQYDLAALGPVPTEDVEGPPKRLPRVAARRAKESVAALPENFPNKPLDPSADSDGSLATKPQSLQNSPIFTSDPRLKHEDGNSFVEPALAVPKPGFSGHTLESFPPAKLKRAAVVTGKGRRGRKPALAVGKPDNVLLAEREKHYILHLQTVKLEALCQPSELRERVSKSRKPSQTKLQVISIPETPLSTFNHHSSPGRSIRRLKITSPKKPPALIARSAPEIPELSDDNNNDDYCSTCGGTGVFICCDSCPKSFHLLCCNPPLQEIPEENWNCTECLAKHDLIPRKPFKNYGMFSGLLSSIHGRNPTDFRLPKKLRDGTFMDVSTRDGYQYSDGSIKPELPVLKSAQLNGYNKNEELEVDALYDSHGRPRFCHKCKMSGLQRRTMVSCDFCPLWWHLDCLPGVVCLAKTLGQKWRCPNHIESMIPSHWLERRSFKDALVLDASLQNNFLQFVQANNFLIKYKDQPFFSEDVEMTLQEYQQGMTLVGKNTGTFEQKYGNYSQVESEDDDDVDENYTVPDYMQNYAIDNRVMAKSSSKLARVLLMTNGAGAHPFIYRVPEQSIVLDFINSTNGGEIKKNIAYYEEHKKLARHRDMDAVNVLLNMQRPYTSSRPESRQSEFSGFEKRRNSSQSREPDESGDSNGVKDGTRNLKDPNGLHDAHEDLIIGDAEISERSWGNESGGAQDESFQTLETEEEIQEIRRFIELKGKYKLMEVLKSYAG